MSSHRSHHQIRSFLLSILGEKAWCFLLSVPLHPVHLFFRCRKTTAAFVELVPDAWNSNSYMRVVLQSQEKPRSRTEGMIQHDRVSDIEMVERLATLQS